MSGDNRSDLTIPDAGLIESGPEPEQQQSEQAERELSPRERAMAAIYEKADAQREAQIEAAEQEIEQLPEHALERDDVLEDAPQQRQAATPRRQQQDSAQPQLHPVEVDGQTIYATPSQVAELAKMGAIAQREIARFNAQQAQGWQPPAPQFQPQPQPQQQQPLVDRQKIAETVRAMQYGDDQTAGDALLGLVNDVVARQPNPEAIINRRLAELQHKQYVDQAQVQLRLEFPDVFADPIRMDAAARQVALLRNHAAQIGWRGDEMQIFRQAAVNVRASMGMGAPQPSDRQGYLEGSNVIVRRSAGEIDARKRAAPRAMSSGHRSPEFRTSAEFARSNWK